MNVFATSRSWLYECGTFANGSFGFGSYNISDQITNNQQRTETGSNASYSSYSRNDQDNYSYSYSEVGSGSVATQTENSTETISLNFTSASFSSHGTTVLSSSSSDTVSLAFGGGTQTLDPNGSDPNGYVNGLVNTIINLTNTMLPMLPSGGSGGGGASTSGGGSSSNGGSSGGGGGSAFDQSGSGGSSGSAVAGVAVQVPRLSTYPPPPPPSPAPRSGSAAGRWLKGYWRWIDRGVNDAMDSLAVGIHGSEGSTVESFVPIWGSFRGALHHYANENYFQGTMYVGFMILDVATLGTSSLARGAGRKVLTRLGFKGFAQAAAKTAATDAAKACLTKGAIPRLLRPLFGERTLGALNWLLGRVCFAAGTPLLTPNGSKPIEEFLAGDTVLSRDENDPDGPIEAKLVEEVFVRHARLMYVTVNGIEIGTTAEHPFYVPGQGWTAAEVLKVGDALVGHDGQQVRVESIRREYDQSPVYNLRVADYHTYFVGTETWGFSVWSHNLNCSENAKVLRKTLTNSGKKAAVGEAAAHLAPTGKWLQRSQKIRDAVANVQRIVNEAKIGLNHAANGFFTNSGRHLGTHTNKFIIFLEGELAPLAGNRGAILAKLSQISADLLSGVLKF